MKFTVVVSFMIYLSEIPPDIAILIVKTSNSTGISSHNLSVYIKLLIELSQNSLQRYMLTANQQLLYASVLRQNAYIANIDYSKYISVFEQAVQTNYS